MATFTVTHRMRIDDIVVIQTLQGTDIKIGDSITVAGVGEGMDGTFTVLDVPTALFRAVSEEGDYLYDWDVLIQNQLLYV